MRQVFAPNDTCRFFWTWFDPHNFIDRRNRGRNAKVHALADAKGRLIAFLLKGASLTPSSPR